MLYFETYVRKIATGSSFFSNEQTVFLIRSIEIIWLVWFLWMQWLFSINNNQLHYILSTYRVILVNKMIFQSFSTEYGGIENLLSCALELFRLSFICDKAINFFVAYISFWPQKLLIAKMNDAYHGDKWRFINALSF